MNVSAKSAFFVGACIGLYLSTSKKFAGKMSEVAENVQDKISAVSIVKMIDVILGEVVHTTLVSSQRVIDFLLDIRDVASKIDTTD
jgi:hypothetical protein